MQRHSRDSLRSDVGNVGIRPVVGYQRMGNRAYLVQGMVRSDLNHDMGSHNWALWNGRQYRRVITYDLLGVNVRAQAEKVLMLFVDSGILYCALWVSTHPLRK